MVDLAAPSLDWATTKVTNDSISIGTKQVKMLLLLIAWNVSDDDGMMMLLFIFVPVVVRSCIAPLQCNTVLIRVLVLKEF